MQMTERPRKGVYDTVDRVLILRTILFLDSLIVITACGPLPGFATGPQISAIVPFILMEAEETNLFR